MRCRGLHTLANPAYLAGFLCSALLSVAQYCVPGGVRVVSISLSPLPVTLSFTSSSIQSQSGKFCLVQLTINLRPAPILTSTSRNARGFCQACASGLPIFLLRGAESGCSKISERFSKLLPSAAGDPEGRS